MPESVGIYIVNDNFVMVQREDGGRSTIPIKLYDDADYRPSSRFLPTAEEYRAEHGEDA